MKKIIYLLGFFILGIIVSCEREGANIETDDTNNTVKVVGEWEVMAYNDSTFIQGPFRLTTLKSTPVGNDSITLQDSNSQFWPFQVKVSTNKMDGTFETKLSRCELWEEGIGIKIQKGIIINSDSIYFEIQFEDDEIPYANTYRLSGHRIIE